MNFISTLLGYPLGWVMYACYYITHNYVLSLLFFTVVTRIIMVPFTVKQQKSTVKMSMLKPEMDELQKKYAKNKEKLNEEMMKLYQREGYNPMAGCLPLLIQFPILFGLIDVVYKPLTHILRFPAEIIEAGTAVVNELGITTSRGAMVVQLDIINAVKIDSSAFVGPMGTEYVSAIENLNLNFLGIDLTQIPEFGMYAKIFSDFNPIIFIPIVAGLTALAASLITQKMSAVSADAAGGASMRTMMLMMPLMSMWISFSVRAGVGLYWCFSNVIGAVQSLIMYKFFNPKEAAEKARLLLEERREQERRERIEAKKHDPNKGLSQKELNRRKLAEARRRAAEKYGDTYEDVTDEDLA